MRAAVCTGPNERLAIRELEIPKPRAGEILIRVRACGVCHNDLAIVEGRIPARYPRIPGHEITGEVEDIGTGVPRSYIGSRVGISWIWSTCGYCSHCLGGEEELCREAKTTGAMVDGGYAEYVVAPAAFATRLPVELDYPEAAPMFCAGLAAYKGLKVGGIAAGKKVAILGIGGLGHIAIQLARCMGAEVIAVTNTPDKEQLARELGAHYTVNAREKNLLRELGYLGGADLILSTVSDAREIDRVVEGLSGNGTLVIVGNARGTLCVPVNILLEGRRRIIASQTGSRRDMKELLNICALHHIRPMIERFPLDSVNETHERIRQSKPRFRDVLVME